MPSSRRSVAIACLLALTATDAACPAAEPDLGLKVPSGFRVTLFADADLANDIYAMTLDKLGRVVVTSRGWVKRLDDTDGDGKADKATLLVETKTGGMGMCFDEDNLYFCGDGGVSVYEDVNGTKVKKEPRHTEFALAFSEHGGHAIRRGPDGRLYVIGGNDAGIQTVGHLPPNTLGQRPEGGGIIRLRRYHQLFPSKDQEVIAHGFRNPYDFDFTPLGDIITYDSDTERDFLLPWYSPTRLYHVAEGGHHGWRLPGYQRSLARRDYYADTVEVLCPIGRGSPTGVVCYRHTQFPERYRGGVFALDWTFGKVYFCPMEPDGATYKTKPEVFLKPVGTNGFAPTDCCVAPDGSLFVCIGGRGTRGGVYRVEYVGDGKPAAKPALASKLLTILDAPQPLDAWSRHVWEPLVDSQRAALGSAVGDRDRTARQQVRAIEVITEAGYLSADLLGRGASSPHPSVRCRTAWALGRWNVSTVERKVVRANLLGELAGDAAPRVRVGALNGLAAHLPDIPGYRIRDALVANLAHTDKRVQLAAIRLASSLPEDEWALFESSLKHLNPRGRMAGEIAYLSRPDSKQRESALPLAAVLLDDAQDVSLCLDAVRVIMLAYGDWNLASPPAEVYSAYSLPYVGPIDPFVLRSVRKRFPSGDGRLDTELSRLLAMFGDNDPRSVEKVLGHITAESSPTMDVHYLIVLARLQGKRDPKQADAVAAGLLGLERKLQGLQLRIKQNWDARLGEVVDDLLAKQPGLADAILRHPGLVSPAHVGFALRLLGQKRTRAARLFLEGVRKDADFAWSGPLVELLARLPVDDVRPVFREHWGELGLRDAIVSHLARKPEPADRERFLDALESSQPAVALVCLQALGTLPRDPSPSHLIPVLRLLRQSLSDQKAGAVRKETIELLNRQAGQNFAFKEDKSDAAALTALYRPVFDWFAKAHPAEAKALAGGGEDLAAWARTLAAVPWEKGDAGRGEKLFRTRACATCHSGSSRIGPDLAGAAGRFSRDDVFTAILDPSRDVAPAYRVNDVETHSGKRLAGIVVFESADGILLQVDAGTTVRIAADDIASRVPTNRSLMPNGLLKDMKPEDLADLYSYLKSIKTDGK